MPCVANDLFSMDGRCPMAETLTAPTAVGPTRAPAIFARPDSVTNRIVWRYLLPIVAVHVLALGVFLPWLFSWTGVVLLVVGIYVYGGLGINIAYHRLLTHRSFKCPTWWEQVMVIIAICCLEDAPGSWVATHRLAPQRFGRASRSAHAPGRFLLEPHGLAAGREPQHPRRFQPMSGLPATCCAIRFTCDCSGRCCRFGFIWPTRPSISRPVSSRLCGLAGGDWLLQAPIRPEPAGLGRAAANRLRLAHHLVGQFRGPRLRLPQLRNRRGQPQQLAGRLADQRRRLAQQPPHRSGQRLELASLVGSRSDVYADLRHAAGRPGQRRHPAAALRKP